MGPEPARGQRDLGGGPVSSSSSSLSVASPTATTVSSSAAGNASSSSSSASLSSQVLIQTSSSAVAPTSSASSPSDNWVFAGCVTDSIARALTGYAFQSSSMTVELCTSTCAVQGFSMAGVENASECYCECHEPVVQTLFLICCARRQLVL